jgi:DNA-binding response OmpR family regulator
MLDNARKLYIVPSAPGIKTLRTMKKSVLVIEDDRKISGFVARGLVAAGFEVDECHDGERALDLLANKLYNVAILDLMLPKIDGWSILNRFKKATPAPPIIVLSAKRSVSNRVECLAAGADDFLTKPFSLAELLARVQAVLRRSSPRELSPIINVNDLMLDIPKKRAERGGEAIDLQPREFALLEYLMRHVDQPVSKTTILEYVWGYDFDPQTNVVDVLVWRLRNKVDRGFGRDMIKTIRGVGYVLTCS